MKLFSRLVSLLLLGFVVARADSVVVINEIFYHPVSDDETREWVELYNQQAVDVDIGGWKFTNGIEYTFPPGTRITGRGYLVVAFNPGNLMSTTPGLTGVLGPFTGHFSNGGEKLELSNNSGRVMDEVDYKTSDAWPEAADGAGPSLAKRLPSLGGSRPDSWTASAQIGGTPGGVNFPAPLVPTVSFNEAGPAGSGGFLELINHGTVAVDLGNLKLVRHGGLAFTYPLPSQQLAPGALAVFTATTLGIDIVDGDRFSLQNAAGTLVSDAVRVDAVGRARVTPLGEWAFPTAPTPGLANTFAFQDAVVINEIMYQGRAILPQPPVTEVSTPITMTSTWKYQQAGVDLGTAWHATNYDDSTWSSGPGLFGSASTGNYGVEVSADAPIAYWKLDDAGAVIADSSGFNHTGTATAGMGFGTAPLVGGGGNSKAMTFTGSNRITVPGFEKIGASGYTVEFWVKVLTQGNYYHNLVGDGESPPDFFLMNYLTGSGQIRPHYSYDNAPVSLDSSSSLVPGQTYHVVTTWDTSTTTGNGRIYLNGVLNLSGNVSANVPAPGTKGNNRVYLGYDDREVAISSFVLDEVALYNKPLSAGRIAAHYAAGSGPASGDTVLTAGPNTHYFRRSFNFSGNPAATELTVQLAVDDGAVLWLNGQELYRHNMPAGAVTYATPASSEVNGQTFTAKIPVPSANLINGNNVLAVEVHQHPASNDVIFGLELTATTTLSPGVSYAKSTENWIELYNKSGAEVDLTGWHLDAGIDYAFPNGTKIVANGYLVVAKDPAALAVKFPGLVALGPYDSKLSRSGEKIALKDAMGNKADAVEYFDGGRWPLGANGGGSSLELRDARADNSAPEAWAASDESGRAAWQTYTYRLTASPDSGPTQWNDLCLGLLDAGEILLDDVSVIESPTGTPVQKITNGNFSGGATGWRFLGTHKTSTVEAEPGNPGNQVLHLRATGEVEHMHNHIETTYTGNSPLVNGREYEVSFRAKVLTGSRQLHTRLYHNRVARLTTLAVSAQSGTPGAANSRKVANVGPTFRNLRQSPAVPAAVAPVTITVEASDPDGVTNATLFYTVNGGSTLPVTMTQANGVWTGVIPGQSAGALAQYFVRAVDGLTTTADFPALGPASRALVIWNDGLANLPLAHNFRLLLTAADRNTMFASKELMSNASLRGTVIYDESEVFPDVAVRLKGSERGRTEDARVSYRVEFDPMQLFRGTKGSVSIDRSGNWGYAGSPFGQNEILVKHMIAAAGGVSSAYDDIIRLVMPGTAHTGPALLQLDGYNSDYLDSAYANGGDGSLWKMELIYFPTTTDGAGYKLPLPDNVVGVDLADRGSDKESYRWFALHENNVERDDWDGYIALARAASLSGPEMDAALAPLIDGSEWARCFALQTLCGIGDAYTRGNNHNIYFYQRPADGRLLALPWDWDFAFYQGTATPIYGDQNATRILQRPAYQRLYYAHLQNLMDTVFSTTYMSYWTNHYDNFTPGQDFSPLLSYIDSRRSFVLSQLPTPAAFAITNAPANNSLTGASQLALSGTAPWGAATVQLSGPGGTFKVGFSTVNNWTGTMPLLLGKNQITLTAYDVQGVVVGTQTFNVVSVTTNFVDTDADGLPDAWEATNGLGTLPNGTAAQLDSDGDGMSNRAEYFAGTNPRDPASVFTLTATTTTPGQVSLRYMALAGRTYRVMYRESLTAGNWVQLSSRAPTNADQAVEVTDTIGATPRYYRLETP